MKFANIDMSGSLINIGDYIQPMAIMNLYKFMGIPSSDVQKIDNRALQTYSGEALILPVNCVLWAQVSSECLFSPDIYPVFLGVSFPEELSAMNLEYLRRWEPIGCRDEATYYYLQKNGIHAYLAGCLTVSLPKRIAPLENKVFFIDPPRALLSFVPKELLKDALFRKNEMADDFGPANVVSSFALAKHRYEELAQKARLVVTSRLHIAAPCIAMGIPVIVCGESMLLSTFSWIDKYIPLYRSENYSEIDWNPKSNLVNEQQKREILNVAAEHLWYKYHLYRHQENSGKLTEFYLDRQKHQTLTRKDAIPKIISNILTQKRVGEKFRYTLWGSNYRSQLVHEAVQHQWPNSELIAVYDSFKTGKYLGCIIEHPRKIACTDKDTYHFVCVSSVYNTAKTMFESWGLTGANYCLLEVELRKLFTGNGIVESYDKKL